MGVCESDVSGVRRCPHNRRKFPRGAASLYIQGYREAPGARSLVAKAEGMVSDDLRRDAFRRAERFQFMVGIECVGS